MPKSKPVALPENIALLSEVNRSKPEPNRPKFVVVLSDIHLPYSDVKALGSALDFIKDQKPDEIILNGDIVDMHGASLHGDAMSENLIQQELEAVNVFLDYLQKIAPQAKIHFNEGNHEERFTRYIATKAPNLRGMTSLPRELRLAERGISWLEYGKVHFISSKLGATHGVFCGVHYAKETLVRYGMSCVVGHAHRSQMHIMGVVNEGEDTVRGCFGNGCLCPLTASYVKGPTGWVNGFSCFYVKDDGSFTPYLILMNQQSFIWAGKQYGGK